MATPTPVFPAAVATAANIKVANNLITTTLRVGIDAANTILFVNSVAGFSQNMLVSIDNEIIAIADVVPSPNAALLVASGGRGFDGTTAAMHAAGARVAVLIVAWHHNALGTEIQAIEAFIGPNGQNIGAVSSGVLNSNNYRFEISATGGPPALTAGVNVVTISPVPLGVNGSNTKHYLYISKGTGAAEAVLITGGTAVSGAASGTLTFTCVNAHSGAWTIQTATAGVQEALWIALPNKSRVVMPGGLYTWYAKLSMPGSVSWRGAGMGQASITMAAGFTGRAIEVNNAAVSNVDIGDFNLNYTTNGSSGECLYLNNISDSFISNLLLNNSYDSITVNSAYRVELRNMTLAPRNNAFNLSNCVVRISSISANMNGVTAGTGVFCTGTVENLILDGFASDGGAVGFSYSGTSGDLTETQISNCQFDSSHEGCIEIEPMGSAIVSDLRISNSRMVTTTSASFGILLKALAPGALSCVDISNTRVLSGSAQAIVNLQGTQAVKITGSTLQTNSIGGTGVEFAVLPCTDTVITGCIIGIGSQATPANGVDYGIFTDNAAHARVTLSGNNINGNVAAILWASTAASGVQASNNIGVDTVIPTVASAATISAPVNPLATVFKLSGVTAVTAINGFWPGRTVRILYPAGAGVTVLGRALAAGGGLTLTADGTSSTGWY